MITPMMERGRTFMDWKMESRFPLILPIPSEFFGFDNVNDNVREYRSALRAMFRRVDLFAADRWCGIADGGTGALRRLDSTIGASGATAAQVQQAISESGLAVTGAGIKVGVSVGQLQRPRRRRCGRSRRGAAVERRDGAQRLVAGRHRRGSRDAASRARRCAWREPLLRHRIRQWASSPTTSSRWPLPAARSSAMT